MSRRITIKPFFIYFPPTRYSAGLNGFTVEGDHLPVAVEDTAAVAEARAAFMAYMIELMAEQKEGGVEVLKLEDEGAINLGQVGESLICSMHRRMLPKLDLQILY